jgi:hypothetical protein
VEECNEMSEDTISSRTTEKPFALIQHDIFGEFEEDSLN